MIELLSTPNDAIPVLKKRRSLGFYTLDCLLRYEAFLNKKNPWDEIINNYKYEIHTHTRGVHKNS